MYTHIFNKQRFNTVLSLTPVAEQRRADMMTAGEDFAAEDALTIFPHIDEHKVCLLTI